ncbi:ATP-binding cassette domain-containing protein [Staphylococcus aureus]|uniref:ATP-binding cassette domain-containing protein n=1 Tax=Staphylococcus aureus TaxID=1280 RepID=UPI002175E734|nr:ATP-binding cassette domain-containing protein [Staphylococcus aureus]MCS5189593.1 ATP-binding cassette domain-containing protein [Staphylococcus aureus]MCS5197431.1 ATP-binding cassette domain-containing protein [Staphylococcus aureus]MCS5200899.1 ATP-binding cassette domain-containing protein [Staphylococcus aureus]
MATGIVNINNVKKTINGNTILNNLNLTIPKNSITLIDGYNGSGKSVTLKLIAKIYKPTSGKLISDGVVSYAPDQFPTSLNLTLDEYFNYLKKIYKLPTYSKMIDYMVSNFNLEQFLDFKVNNCSKGTRQKVNIIQCLVKPADIYILDEPFSGLDKDSIYFLANYLCEIKSKATIIISSHEHDINKKIINHTFNLKSNAFSKQYFNKTAEVTIIDFSNADFEKAIKTLNFSFQITKENENNRAKIIVPFSKTNITLLTLIKNNLTVYKVISKDENL